MNAVIYARYSSENQREESIDAQLRACREYADERGLVICGEYIDRAKSGRTDARPDFLRLCQDAELRQFSVVLIHKINRFARNKSDYEFYKRHLASHGVAILSATERIDGSPEGALLESVMQGISEFYSRDLARETWKGLKENALQARWNGGIPPLGYDVGEGGKLVINPSEAAVVRRIFEMRACGSGLSEIVREMNSRGFLTKRRQAFGKNSIHDLLRNERYLGHYIYARTARNERGSRNSHAVSQRVIRIENAIPAIVDVVTWEKTRGFDKKCASSRAAEVYLLSGQIKCGLCGASMVGSRRIAKGKKYIYYRCGLRERKHVCEAPVIGRALAEGAALKAIRQELLSPENRQRILASAATAMNKRSADRDHELKALAAATAETKRKIKNLITLAESGRGSPALVDRLAELESGLRGLQAKSAVLKKTDEPGAVPDPAVLESYLTRYAEALAAAEAHGNKAFKPLIDQFVQSLVVYKEKIVVNLGIVPTSRGEVLRTVGNGVAVPLLRKTSPLLVVVYSRNKALELAS